MVEWVITVFNVEKYVENCTPLTKALSMLLDVENNLKRVRSDEFKAGIKEELDQFYYGI